MGLTNSQVRHLFAQQTKDRGKSSNGNFSFEGQVLYSYSTPIARFYPNADGEQCVFITTESHGVTTNGKHMPGRHDFSGVKVFHVPYIGTNGGRAKRSRMIEYNYRRDDRKDYRDDPNGQEFHIDNMNDFMERIDKALLSFTRARKNKIYHINMAQALIREANAYKTFFKLDFDHVNLHRAFTEEDMRKIEEDCAEVIAKEREKMAQKLAISKDEFAELKAEFLAYERNSIPYNIGEYETPTLLRVERCGTKILTSRGAEFPVEQAKEAFKIVALVRKKKEAIKFDWGKKPKLGYFTIDKISEQGHVTAGCHYVKWDAIKYAADQLNLNEEEVANG